MHSLLRFSAFVVLLGASTWAQAEPFGPLPLDRGVPAARKLFEARHLERFGLTFHPFASLCSSGQVRCLAKILTDEAGVPLSSPDTIILGYTAKQLQKAYGVSGTALAGTPILAIVSAYHDENAYQDLKVYSRKMDLPVLPKCAGAVKDSPVPCYQAVNEKGGDNLPNKVDLNWTIETALDLEMAHALCSNCSILLVEANTNQINHMGPAENTAAALGATAISNSWALLSGETSGETFMDRDFFTHPGIAITASSGDEGYGVDYPAASPNVVAVGGTSLFTKKNGAYQSESAWKGAGSGCSAYEARPSWQPQMDGCPNNRTTADISMVADPNTGVAVYNTPACPPQSVNCWFKVGGTSVSAPLVASMYAAAGGIPSTETQAAKLLYQNTKPANTRDITSGSNGTCSFGYLCTAVPGYDGPTGLGTPVGLGVFSTAQ